MQFRERLIGPRWMAAIGAACIVFIAVIAVVSLPVLIELDDPKRWQLSLLLGAVVLIVTATGVFLMVRRMTVTVAPDFITAYLDPFRVMRIPLRNVTEVEVIDVTPLQAGGLGWRTTPSAQYLLLSAGPAVKITRSSRQPRVLRSDRADELATAIKDARLRQRPQHPG